MIINKLICRLPREFNKILDFHVPYNEVILLPTRNSKSFRNILQILFVSGVYFLCSKKEVVYVGFSCNIGQRLWGHFYSKGKDDVNRSGFIRYKDDVDIMAIEAMLIDTFKPKYNRQNQHSSWMPGDFDREGLIEAIKKKLGIK